MEKKASPIPAGFHTITPCLIVADGAKALEFYKKVFKAQEVMRLEMPNGKIAHSEIRIGDSIVMVADDCSESGSCDPRSLKGTPVMLQLYVENVDDWVDRAVDNGAKIVRPVADHFYGDRAGMVEDPFGHLWHISTRQENVSPEEMKRRFSEMMKK